MKRSWIGFILLLLLLAGSVLVTRAMENIHEPIHIKLQQAAQCALEEDWDRAASLFRQAEEDWKAREHFRTCVADHTPAEEVDASFELLRVLCAARERVSFAGGCQSLARQVAAVGEAHALVWWNLL